MLVYFSVGIFCVLSNCLQRHCIERKESELARDLWIVVFLLLFPKISPASRLDEMSDEIMLLLALTLAGAEIAFRAGFESKIELFNFDWISCCSVKGVNFDGSSLWKRFHWDDFLLPKDYEQQKINGKMMELRF
jgi:hypothetical protein